MARGDGTCPFPDCGRIIDGAAIKAQAQAGQMGEQLFAVVCKRRETVRTKTGRAREKWVRGYRAPRPEDDDGAALRAALDEKLAEWDAFDFVPNERFPEGSNDDRPIQYGMPRWRDLFSPRQLLCHRTSVEVFREMLDADREAGKLDEARRAAYGYLALTLDTLLNYNNRSGRWDNTTGRVRSIFDRHDFVFVWSDQRVPVVVEGGRLRRRPARGERHLTVEDEGVDLAGPQSARRPGDGFEKAVEAGERNRSHPVRAWRKPVVKRHYLGMGAFRAVRMASAAARACPGSGTYMAHSGILPRR